MLMVDRSTLETLGRFKSGFVCIFLKNWQPCDLLSFTIDSWLFYILFKKKFVITLKILAHFFEILLKQLCRMGLTFGIAPSLRKKTKFSIKDSSANMIKSTGNFTIHDQTIHDPKTHDSLINYVFLSCL